MNVEYHHWHSPILGQKFELKRYGHAGVPMMAFPSSEGHFWDYADHGMIDVARPWIDAGKLQVVCVDGRDWETWSNTSIGSWDRADRHNAWDAAIAEEVVPWARQNAGLVDRRMILTGCSGGAYHAANFLFRHPDLADAALCLSGVYSTKYFRTDHVDDYDYGYPAVYFNNPLRYLRDLDDEWYLSRLRASRIILCCGQGSYEEECLDETCKLSQVLHAKGIEHWLDIWGKDVNHDWPWWRQQLAYFLGKMDL
jgi:esterase/lipase superfamily enzyme